MIKKVSIPLHKQKFLYTCDAKQKQIVEKLRKVQMEKWENRKDS